MKKKSRKSKIKRVAKFVDISPEELELSKAKAKLSMWVDGDVLAAIRLETKEVTGTEKGYQTYLNKKLRELFLNEKNEVDFERIDSIEQRLRILEKAIGA
jgi:hypothetical protein